MNNQPAPLCPRCGDEPLVWRGAATAATKDLAGQCPRCHGIQMPLGVLSDRSDQNLVPRLWAAADAYPRPGIACAFCWQPSLSLVAHEVELDLCRSCRSLWFDAHELERLPIRGALNQQPSIGRTDADSKVGFFAGDVADEVFRSGDKMDLVGDAAEISSVVGETINALSALIGDWG